MWVMPDAYREALGGDYSPSVTASALYGGRVTEASLPVVGCRWRSAFDGQQVRASITLSVDDPDGSLTPMLPTDPLAPFGQQVVVRWVVGWGDVSIHSLPIGAFRVQKPQGSSSWLRYRVRPKRVGGGLWPGPDSFPSGDVFPASGPGRLKGADVMLPTGGVVTLEGEDLQMAVEDAEIPGLMQPLPGASVASEVQRLCAGLVGVDMQSIPVGVVPRAGTYESGRMQTVRTLLDRVGRVPAPGRDGSLRALSPLRSTTPDLVVMPGDAEVLVSLDDDGLVNVVLTTGEEADSPIRGAAYESSGPYRHTGPLGPRIHRHSSPLYTTSTAANAGAVTILSRLTAAREVVVRATMPCDPSVDVLDTHRVWLAPGLTPLALVTEIEADLMAGGDMQVTYSVAREEVDRWTRPRVG